MAKKTNLGTFTIVKQDEEVIISVKSEGSTGSSFLPANYTIDDLASKIALLIKNVSVAKNTKNKLTIDLVKEIIVLNGDIIPLLAKETKLLRYFSLNSGRIISREELLEKVWGRSPDSTTRTLDVHISRLRSKLEADPANPEYILTARGLGYMFQRIN